MNDFTAAAELLKQQQTGAVSPLARAAETMKAQQAGQVGMALTYDERDPDAVAKSQQVGGALGISPAIVGGDPEAYDLQLRMKQAADGLRRAPKTAAWLADRENGVLAKDDLDNLTWWERVLNAPAQGFVEMGDAAEGSVAGRALERGVRRIPMIEEQGSADTNARVLADVGKTLDDIYKEEIARFGANPPYVVQADARRAAQLRFDLASNLNADDITRIIRSGSDALMRAKERTDQIAAVPMSETATRFRDGVLSESENTLMGVLSAFASDPLGGAAFTAETATEFVPAMIAASAVTAATRSPGVGAAVMGMASGLTENASSAMELLNEMGVKLETPEDAAAVLQNAEIMKAARERGLSRGLVIGMMDAISGGVAGKQLAKSPIGDMIAQGIAQIGFGAGGEAAGQIAAGQQVSWKDIVIEGLAELATAPIEILGVGGRRLLRETIDAETAGKTATMLADVDTQAMVSKLRERAPDKFKEALDAQGLGDKAVYVPADALREYFQAKDMALDDATATAWGIDPIAFEEAAQSGNDVAIPMSNYATYIAGTDAAQWFAENATSDPDEMSIATAKAFNDAVQDVMQEAFYEAERARLDMEEARAADVQIYDQMFSELRAAGRSPDVAQREAQVWTAFWRTMGERYGDDPLSLARSMGVKVLGPQSPEFRRRDQLDIALNTLRTQGAKALKPKGLSLAEFVKAKGGIQDVGGDVAALDPPKGVVAETAEEMKARASQPSLGGVMPAEGRGLSLDEMGRLAAEAGYFPDLMGEVNLGTKGEASDFAARLLEALGDDVAGRKVYAEGEGPDANLQALSDALSARGIDIATATNDEIAAALEATDGSTLNQGQDKPLYVVHNLSAENLRHALELGGLAAPSLAIARGDIGMDNFGEISLIGDPSMADPKGRGAKAFNADVYSPRQPRAQYDINGKPLRAMMDVLGDAASALQESPQGNIDPDRVSREGLSALENQDVVKMAYLMDIGDAPKVIYKKTEPIPTAMKKWVGKPRWEIAADPEFISALKDDIERQIAALPDDLKEGMREAITDRKLPGGEPSRFMVEEKARALAEAAGKRKVDSYETGRAIRKRMGKTKAREGQFRSWLEKKFGDVLGAKFFTNDAGRRKPYEIDAIVREMTRTVRDGEGWNYGVGSIRSTVAQQFKTIKQIQASRDKVVDSATMDKLKEEATNELVALADKFAPYHASSSDFGWLDIFSEFLKDLSRGRLREWQTSIFDEAAPPELIAEARAYLGKLSEMPTEYFEIKMQRAVGLDEFKAALVPSDASADTVKALKDAGLEVVKYKRDNEGRGRTEALQKLGEKVFFQSAPLKTDTPEFKAWFGDSKVVDENGDPIVVHHATFADFDAFSMEFAGRNTDTNATDDDLAQTARVGFWFSENDAVKELTGADNVVDAYLSIKRPHEVSLSDLASEISEAGSADAYRSALVDDQFDGLKVHDQEFGGTSWVALRPEQIKSVNNRGTFDPADPRILYQPDGSSGNRGSIVLPQGGVRAGQTVINLFESANLSTFIHESGHFFLEAFNALASEEHAPQAMKDDLAAIFAWLGVKGWGQVGVPQHEQWARGFEAYVMEGKAPSLALADAFARFKAWLTRIYRTARGLKVNITPEIREVMDRMLATDAEIKAAREEQAMRPLFADAPPGMSQTDFTTYQRMARRAVDQAEQSLMARVMAKVRREREAWYRAEKKAVLAEVTADVERRREYRLVDLLANQVWHGAVDGAEIPDMQIDRKALVEQFGDGVLAEVSRQRFGGRRAIYGDNGAAPEEVAQFFGFASAAEMVRTLQNAPRKRDAIAAEVERRMVERHGDPLNDGTIEEEALAAIHSEQQANLSVAEARHMARRLGRDTAGMTAKIYRRRAREMVGRMMVRDVIRPERFLASERKAARAAQDAFATVARGTGAAEQALAEALQAKEQQILNGFIYDEARKVAEYVQKGREKMRAYAKKSVREKLDGGYIEQIDAILEDYDFRIRGQRQIARAESLKTFVDRMIEEGREGELNVDARLIDAVNRRHYTKLSVDELRGLFDTVANIDHMGRFKQRLADRKRKRELQASADRVSGLIRKNLGTGKAGWRHRIAEAFNLLWRTDTLLIRMDGGEELGGAYDEIKRSIDEATSEEHRMNVEMAERLDALFKSHYSDADIRRMKAERDIPGANDRAWSKLEILAVALNTGNEDNYLRLIAPDAAMKNRLTKAQVDVLLATMDENDWRFVQAMWGMVDSYWSGLAEVAQRRTGVVPKKVEAKLMVGAPSFVTGGYYPIVYDPALSASAAADEASAWDKFTATGRGATAAIRNGMTKQRAKSGGGRTLRLDVSVAFAHMRDTIRYIALSEAVDNTYRLISHPDVQNAFLDAGAKDQHDILKLWLKDVAKGPSPSPDAFNTMFRIIKNNFTLSRLALNFKTVALQVTGVGQSAVVIGKRNMIRGYLEYLRNPRGTAAAVVARSTFMRERRSTFQKDIHDFMDDTQLAGPVASGYKKGKAVVGKIGFAPIVWTQFWAVDMPTWLGAFRAGVEKFGDESKAAHYADRMVARSQDSGLMADRAAFERGTLSETTRQADVVRFFTTLGGYMLTKMNRGYVETMRARIGWRDADAGAQRVGVVLTAATNLALLYWTEAIITALLWSALGDDDDDDDLKGFLLRETGSAVVGGIPIIRDAYSALMGYGGGGIYGSVADAPARLLTQVAQGENDAALRRAIGDSVGMITGLPTTGPMRAIEGALSDDVPMSEALLGRNPMAR